MELNCSTYRRLQNQVNNRIYYEKRSYHRKEIQNNLGNPKTFWKTVKNVAGGKSNATRRKMSSIKTDNGVIVIDKKLFIYLFIYLNISYCSKIQSFLYHDSFESN